MNKIQKELEAIGKRNGGLLRPCDVVEFAKDEKTALHSRFEWDDQKAGDSHRLWQARQILRIEVVVLENDSKLVRAFVSLKDDRQEQGGGYRLLTEVLSNKDLRAKMLNEALDEAELFKRKWERLVELKPIFEAIDKVWKNRANRGRKSA